MCLLGTVTQWDYRSKLLSEPSSFQQFVNASSKVSYRMQWVQQSVYNFLIGPRVDIEFYLKGFDFDKLLNTFKFEGRLRIHVHSKNNDVKYAKRCFIGRSIVFANLYSLCVYGRKHL